jgi:hypothetical protein
MSRDVKESDWRTLRALHPIALDRFCERILKEIASVSKDTSKTHHERYLEIYRLIDDRDGDISVAFNDMRRSTAVIRILALRQRGLLTDEEFARFSDGMRQTIEGILTP